MLMVCIYISANGSGFPPCLIPALQNISILQYKKAKLPKHLQHSVSWKKIQMTEATIITMWNLEYLIWHANSRVKRP